MRDYVEKAKKLLRSGVLNSVNDALDLASEAPEEQAEEILALVEEHDKASRRGAFRKYYKNKHGITL